MVRPLRRKAEVMGLELAKTLNAEAFAVTVSEPVEALSMWALAERTMSNPIGNYEECVKAPMNRTFFRVGGTAMENRNRLQDATCEGQLSSRWNRRDRARERLRPRRHVLPWTVEGSRGVTRQSSKQSGVPSRQARADLPLVLI